MAKIIAEGSVFIVEQDGIAGYEGQMNMIARHLIDVDALPSHSDLVSKYEGLPLWKWLIYHQHAYLYAHPHIIMYDNGTEFV
jgi:hypothetical protein